jgi:hypothetical protein
MGLLNFFIVIAFMIFYIVKLGLEDFIDVLKFKIDKEFIGLSWATWIFIIWGISNLIYYIIN